MNQDFFYYAIANDMKKAGLSKEQAREAFLINEKDDQKAVIHKAIEAAWMPSNMTPMPTSGYDFDAQSSYQAGGQRLVEEGSKSQVLKRPVEDEVFEDQVDEENEEHNRLVQLVTETATLADKKGFVKQAQFLDNLLLFLV